MSLTPLKLERPQLPFHDPFESEWDAHRRRKRGGRLPLVLKTIATQVAQTVGMCLETHGGSWNDAVAGEVMIDDLFLLELRWVSENTWQPVLAVYRY